MKTRQQFMIRHCATVAVLLCCGVVTGTAQERPPSVRKHAVSRGTVELGGTIGFTSVQAVQNGKTGDSQSIVSLEPVVGYFIIDGVEVGLSPAGLVYVSAGSSSVTQIRSFGFVGYNFQTSTMVVPYVEGLAGYAAVISSNSGTTTTRSGFCWGGQGGIKVGVAEHANLVIGVQYVQITLDPSGASTRTGTNEFSVNVGWTVWL
jgi:hypothetical protein